MTTVFLVLLAVLLPPVWGWAMHALMGRWWPPDWHTVEDHEAASTGIEPRDYQI